jgi:hypothetical protein
MDILNNYQPIRNELTAVVPHCYHCGVRKLNLLSCEIWGIRICPGCLATLHKPHHPSCDKEGSKKSETSYRGPPRTTFTLNLTHYSGTTITLTCHRGMGLMLEDHWAGTYILYASGMTLVLESRDEINLAIIDGLKILAQED